MNQYCNNSWSQIVEMLNSNIQNGITENECDLRRENYGTNKIDLPTGNRLSKNLFSILKEKSTIMYLLILICLFLFKYYLFEAIISIVLLFNLVIKIIHNIKKEKEIGFLEKLNFTDTNVIRDGRIKTIKSEELVIGDIVTFSSGTLIPADIRIIKANEIKVSEKNITGETFYKEKFESKITGIISSLSDMKNILFKGSEIKSGDGIGIVIGTGNSTQLGRLLTMLTYANNRKHTFDKDIEKQWSKYLLIYTPIIILIGLIIKYSGGALLNPSIALFIIGFCPIYIIVLITYRLVIKDFLKENINIINFSVFNLIRDINILFLDKIGSISKNNMITRKIFINDNLVSIEKLHTRDITYNRIIEISLICNNSTYNVSDDTGKGNLIEIGILRYAAIKQIYKASIDGKNPRVFEIPIDSDKRFLTVVSRLKNKYRANSRGILDGILERCTHIMIDGVERELTDEYRTKIKDVDMKFSIEGLITEGFAYRNFNYEPSKSENIESNMVFVGIMALENPLENEIERKINNIKEKAMVPILFTEESKLSAITNAKKANIIRNSNQVVAGIELDTLNKDELKDLLLRVRVFCRINPELKSKIISLFIKDGHKVAATGETLGDLPSLNLSNVGIGKGQASQTVKKVSDIYIENNYLDGFLKIKDYAKKFQKNINRTFNMFYMTVLAEIIVLVLGMILSQERILEFYDVIFINGILLTLLSLITLFKKGKHISNNEILIRASSLGIISVILDYQLDSGKSVITSTVISIGVLIFTLFNSKISFRKKSRELIITLISILLIIIGFTASIFIDNIVFTELIIGEFIGFVIILIIFEILFKRWQNSLMR